jgi:hypothetical protein
MTHLHAGPGIAPLLSAVACMFFLATVETSFADAVKVTDTLEFSTVDQGLFGPGKPVNNLTFPPITFQNQTVGPITKGRIFENISQDVPVEVLQAAWDQALATCQTERSRKIVNYCERYRFTPTQSQCETGNVTLPSSVTINCCTDFGIIDTNVTYPDCASGFGHLPGKADFSVSVPSSLRNFDLGAGIGPRPTEPAPQPFDVGVITTYEAKVNVGLELAIITDAGSVDVSYATKASLGADAGQVSVGQPFTLTVRHEPIEDETLTHMASKYPNINFVFQYFVDLLARLDVDYAHMGTDGQQKRSQESILFYSTANQPDADANGRLVGELVGVELGLTGAEVRIFANQPSGFPADFPAGVIWDFPLAFGWEVTQPFTCPIAGIPKLGTYFCGPPPPLSTDVMELDLRTPALDTPAVDNFDGGVTDFTSFTPVPVLRNELAPDGSLTNTTPSAFRQILSVPGLSGFNSLDDILLDDGRLSTDWFRLDLDLDGLVSLYQGGVNPLGGNFVFGGATKDPTTGENKSVANMEWNALDIDYANWFHVDQTLKFEPKLEVELNFSQPVQVRKNPADNYQTVSQYTLTVAADADTALEIIQPSGGVTITPTYSLRNNRFTNTTNMLWTPALQASFLQVKIEGIIANLLAAVLLPTDDDLNFAVAQATASPPPVVMGPLGGTYSLEGFEDVVSTALVIGALPPGDLDNDDDVDRTDQNMFHSSLGRCLGDASFVPETDYNGSGCTDFGDYSVWFGFYNDFAPPQPCNDCNANSRSLLR